MNTESSQPTLFEVAETLDDQGLMEALGRELLEASSQRQPSAWELCGGLERKFGPMVFWVLRDAMDHLLEDQNLTAARKDYFRWLLKSEDLAKAIQGLNLHAGPSKAPSTN